MPTPIGHYLIRRTVVYVKYAVILSAIVIVLTVIRAHFMKEDADRDEMNVRRQLGMIIAEEYGALGKMHHHGGGIERIGSF
jgi:hypothetical protein